MSREIDVVANNYNLQATIECNQYFRWKKLNEGYLCFQGNQSCFIEQIRDTLKLFISDKATDEQIEQWLYFFNIGNSAKRPDSSFIEIMNSSNFLREAYNFSEGLQLLRQDPWECLVSFIVSQRNSVERIHKCVDNICWAAGTPFDDVTGKLAYSFPAPAALKPSILHDCSLGYREQYIYNAAWSVDSKSLVLDEICASHTTLNVAIQQLVRIMGVGIKVASCVSLFSLGYGNAWPVDVWIERAMQEGNISFDDVSMFGNNAGLVQQYIYYYMTKRQSTKVYFPK